MQQAIHPHPVTARNLSPAQMGFESDALVPQFGLSLLGGKSYSEMGGESAG
jgi:hypothetical protein